MSQDVFDFRELTDFEKKLTNLAQKQMPKETRKFLRTEGNELKKITKRNARSAIGNKSKKGSKKTSGNLLKGIKRGKVYKYAGNGALSVRVYGGKPAYHAHLVNNGHIVHTKEGDKFVQGKHFLEKSMKEFAPKHEQNVLKFIDEMLDKGL